MKLRELGNPLLQALFTVQFAFKVALYLIMDRIDRNALLALFCKNFAGASTDVHRAGDRHLPWPARSRHCPARDRALTCVRSPFIF